MPIVASVDEQGIPGLHLATYKVSGLKNRRALPVVKRMLSTTFRSVAFEAHHGVPGLKVWKGCTL